MENKTVLIADDETTIRQSLARVLGEAGFSTVTAADGLEAVRVLEEMDIDMALLDIRMPGLDGLGVLAKAREISPDTGVIIITAFGSVENAVEAIKLGANDYVVKPFVFDDILIKVRRLLGIRQLTAENAVLREELQGRHRFEGIVGATDGLRKVLDMVQKLTQTRSSVLITGESGTGKELIARAIHHNGVTAGGRFVAINCSALPEPLVESELFGHVRGAFTGANRDKVGLMEMARGGTIFFDEVCSMPLSIQPKLLRAIEEKQICPVGGTKPVSIDVRVLCAANKDLIAEVKAGRFREDVYYRLNVVELSLPPLRQRREDIPLLADHFLKLFARELGRRLPTVSERAMEALMEYSWPGNIRELKNVIERAMILGNGQVVDVEDLAFAAQPPPEDPPTDMDLKSAMRTWGRRHLLRVLAACNHDKTAAARKLQIGLSSLYRKMDELGISKSEGAYEKVVAAGTENGPPADVSASVKQPSVEL